MIDINLDDLKKTLDATRGWSNKMLHCAAQAYYDEHKPRLPQWGETWRSTSNTSPVARRSIIWVDQRNVIAETDGRRSFWTVREFVLFNAPHR